ncbi:MAG: PIN domain-containing protein [Dehalococcoidia bacterium]|nr:PIN domain-containing protein [Dehalococcoidia bacterium]
MTLERFVLDTSAIFAYANDEPGSDAVQRILERARREPSESEVLIPFIALMETHYHLLRQLGPEEAIAAIGAIELLPVEIIESDQAWRGKAAEIKAEGRLSLADAWIAALAYLLDARLVHKDPEFDRLVDLPMVRLPNF